MTTSAVKKPAWHSLDNLISASLGLFAFSVLFSVTAVQAALFLTLIFLLAKKHREKSLPDIRREVLGHPLFIPWAIYLGICLLTSVTAYYPAKGFGQLNSDFLKFLCLFTLLLAVKKEHLPRLAMLYAAAAMIAGIHGVAEVILSNTVEGVKPNRANGFMNAVRYGEVMTIAFTLIMSRLLIKRKEISKQQILFYTLAAVPVFGAIMLSQTRGSYLGLFFAMLFIFIFAREARGKLLVLAGIVLAGGLAAAALDPALKQRVTAMVNPDRSDASFNSPSAAINIRIELWRLGFDMLKAHPVLGVGPDNVKKVFKRFHEGPIGYMETWGSLHNLYLHQAAERGLAGLGALLLLFGTMYSFALKRYRAARSPYTLWALCALPAYFIMNLTEISFQHVHTAFAIFLALAFAAAAEKEADA